MAHTTFQNQLTNWTQTVAQKQQLNQSGTNVCPNSRCVTFSNNKKTKENCGEPHPSLQMQGIPSVPCEAGAEGRPRSGHPLARSPSQSCILATPAPPRCSWLLLLLPPGSSLLAAKTQGVSLAKAVFHASCELLRISNCWGHQHLSSQG